MNYLLLDVDGVINAISSKPPKDNTGWRGEWGQATVEGYPILWSKELVEELNELNARDDFEIVVLSTWRMLAVEKLFPVIGLKVLDDVKVLDPNTQGHNYQRGWGGVSVWWKTIEARDFLSTYKYKRVFWADDDINMFQAQVGVLKDDHPTLVTISPNQNHGLTKKDIASIRSFVV